jgi:ketosteroid isomerase-like protein
MKHANALVLEKFYSDFAKGDFAAMLAICADSIAFKVPGKSPVGGKYDKANFVQGFIDKLMEISGGTLKLEVHDIMASDRHAVVLASDRLVRNGKEMEYRTAHVWRFENGKPVAWYEYPQDLYLYDAIWS